MTDEQCDHNVMLLGPPARCADCGYRYGVDDKQSVKERVKERGK